MFDRIIDFSLNNKVLIGVGVLILIISGLISAGRIPLDAVPDITNNQVQIVTVSPSLAPQEVEQLITYPIESVMTNIPDVVEVRSISRYGLSVVTIVFKDRVPVMTARQYVQEQINVAKSNISPELGEPGLMPITTGLGEIYQYILTVDPAFAHQYGAMELRTIQDWIVKRQLNGIPGIIEISSFGGYLKRYEVAVNPEYLKTHDLTMQDMIIALQENNQNSGGSYLEKGPYSFYIRTEGRARTKEDLENIVVKNAFNRPVLVRDVAEVRIGSAKRYGAMTMDGHGEVVGGITLMLKGANSYEVLANVKERISEIEKTLPEGISIYPYLDRSKLIRSTIETASKNLIEGGLIVIFILLFILGNIRAGLIVASVIPLSMLFALSMMRLFGVSANLMSLGAIDFGIVVDGAVIIVEHLLYTLSLGYIGQNIQRNEMDRIVKSSASAIYRSAAFGVLIILIVFVPILSLQGIEGKTFRPMAMTVGFAILGSLILSLTYIPVMSSLFLRNKAAQKDGFAHKVNMQLKNMYRPFLNLALRFPYPVILSTLMVFALSLWIFVNLGSEFIPTLEEGDIAMQQTVKPGSSLEESIRTSTKAEKILLTQFPEVQHVVSKIGTAEVPTDPMAIEDADIMIILKDKKEWVSAQHREGLVEQMKTALEPITWASYEFTQPIQLRFNELMTGSKSDISIKIFGEEVNRLKTLADEADKLIRDVPGVGDVRVDQTEGLQQLSVVYNRERIAQYGLNIEDLNQIIRSAFAGEKVGNLYEEERKFDLVVTLDRPFRQQIDLNSLVVSGQSGILIPLSEVAHIDEIEGPMLISREQARRYINIGVNARNTDIGGLVNGLQQILEQELVLPPGYELQFGGQFENLQNAKRRLMIAVPMALLLIFLLLYLAFSSVLDALIIILAVPMSAVGGILTLYLRDMPFSISSGVGFIALFGVSVLNGIVLISYMKQSDMRKFQSFRGLIQDAGLTRLRPVLMTAFVAALGFLPMALSTGNGAEVQRPLASVVIGGLITSTLLTLVALPSVYLLVYRKKWRKTMGISVIFIIALLNTSGLYSQQIHDLNDILNHAYTHHPALQNARLNIERTNLNHGAIGQVDPLTVNYDLGEIHYRGIDHFFKIQQRLDFLIGKDVQRSLVDAQVAVAENKLKRDLYELDYRIRLAYNEYIFYQRNVESLHQLQSVYRDIRSKLESLYREGEIDRIDWQLLSDEVLILQKKITSFEAAQSRTFSELRNTAFLSDSIVISDTGWESLHETQADSLTQDHPFLMEFDFEHEKIDRMIDQEEKLASVPGFSAGYFLQTIDGNFGYQGVSFNVSLPLDKRVSKTKVRQWKIDQMQIENEKSLLRKSLTNTLHSLLQRREQIALVIESFDLHLLENREEHIDRLEAKWRSGDIDFFRYSQMIKRVSETELTYFELIREYNQILIELYFLTTKEIQ